MGLKRVFAERGKKRKRESRESVGGIFFGEKPEKILDCESGDDVGRRVLTGYE